MGVSIISISSSIGVACASNTKDSPIRLSETAPILIAFDPNSFIKWKEIIWDYRIKNIKCDSFEDYATGFIDYVEGLEFDEICKTSLVNDCEERVILMGYGGYGEQDLYPYVYCYDYKYINNAITFALSKEKRSQLNKLLTDFSCIGSNKYIYPLLPGVFEKYTDKSMLSEKFVEKFIDFCQGNTNKEYIHEDIKKILDNKKQTYNDKFTDMLCLLRPYHGISYSTIEEMALVAEQLVNAEVRLEYLYDGGNKPVLVNNINVITFNEGVTLINK